MQHVLNYGSLLQAYSLKKIISDIGHSVSFIDIKPNDHDNALRDTVVAFSEGLDSTNKGFIYRLLQQDSNPLFIGNKILRKKRTTHKQIDFFQKYLQSDLNDKRFDVCVIGSDEVFNYSNHDRWGFTSQLFGNVTQADKIITYAASAGYSTENELNQTMRDCIKQAFTRISSFSVRDLNTYNIVKSLTGSEPLIHFDPVLIGDFGLEMSGAQSVIKRFPKHYCLVYSYNGRISDSSEIKAIKAFCKKHGLIPISVGGYQKWIHYHFDLTPFEALVAFQNADFVITDTFHGAIFSAKYSDRFGVVVRDSNKNKLADLIERIEIQEHQLHHIDDLERVFQIDKNIKGLDCKIKYERDRAISYFRSSI